jgi:hypothetical protein
MAVLPAEKFWPVLPHSGQGVNEESARERKASALRSEEKDKILQRCRIICP